MKLKNIIIAALSILLVLSLVGCGSKDVGAAPVDEAKEEVRVIEHAMGSTEITGNPQRVVILTNEGTEALLALDVKPVGAVKSWTGNPWYEHIESDMKDVVNVGDESQVNLEEIAALKPDLIIGNKMRQEKIYDQLSLIAPTVFSDTLRGDWRENFEFYAEALNKVDKGTEILANFDARIDSIATKAGDQLDTELSIIRFMPEKTRIYLGDTFSGVILEKIGFARPESQISDEFVIEIGKERIQEADGDFIFYFTYDTGDGQGSARETEWLNDPLFNSLEAVKNGKIMKVDDAIWNTAGGIKAANLMLDDIESILDNNKL
jgi:iron complex transport system substrate-binding protein